MSFRLQIDQSDLLLAGLFLRLSPIPERTLEMTHPDFDPIPVSKTAPSGNGTLKTVQTQKTSKTTTTLQTAKTAKTAKTGIHGSRIWVGTGLDWEELVARTRKVRGGVWHRLCALVRELKAQPQLPRSSVPLLLRDWHERIGDGKSFEELRTVFEELWDSAIYATGDCPMEVAVRAAASCPTPAYAEGWEWMEAIAIAKICRELQRSCRYGPFFLSGKKAGELAGVSQPTGSRILTMLCRKGILELVERGCRSAHLASTYRYIADE